MKLYLISRTDKWDYYEYQWTNNRDSLVVEYLGESNSPVEKVIIASFNAS